MKDILTFMENHPWQTFFLALIALQTIIYVAKYIAVAVRGWPAPGVDDEDDD